MSTDYKVLYENKQQQLIRFCNKRDIQNNKIKETLQYVIDNFKPISDLDMQIYTKCLNTLKEME